MKKIALLFAMEAEAQPLIEKLGLQETPKLDQALPFRSFGGTYKNRIELLLTLNGKSSRHPVDQIGTEPAALSAYLTLRSFKPDLCINAGTAGGFKAKGGEIGDVYLIDQPCRFHDHRIPIPGFDAYGLGSYPVYAPAGMAEALGLKLGAVSTGNSLDHTSACLEIMRDNNASVKEMEATAIAWVAEMLQVPLIVLKAVTDIVDGEHPTSEEFLRNLALASGKLQEKTVAALDYLLKIAYCR
jgi:5'-methylthioadenosine/S-adenosylhomocysteine nucleosidase